MRKKTRWTQLQAASWGRVAAASVSVTSLATEIRRARHEIRRAVAHETPDAVHVDAVVAVAHELLVLAYEHGVTKPVSVTVEPFALHTVVRLGCPDPLEILDDTFHVRERVLTALTIAFGERPNADGGTDLWAEVPRARARI
jgi:hypothetical protein